MAISDEELFVSYRRGDEGALAELLSRHRGPLFNVIYRMTGDWHEAEDIFQETLVRVFNHRAKFDSGLKFSSWLYAIATNLCRDLHRKRARSPLVAAAEPPEPASGLNPERELMESELKSAIGAALATLPEEQREVFLLREYGGLSFKEIAKLTRTNLNTVLGRMHLAMKKLKSELTALAEDEG